MRIAFALSFSLALGCAGAAPRPVAATPCIQPRPWLTPLDAMTCEGLHVLTAHNGVFTSEDGQRWRHESVDPTVRLTRLYCHQGRPWAVGFPGVVVRREPEGSWETELRRDEAHPDEAHASTIRAAFTSLELVEDGLRAHGRTATGESMHWESRGPEWVEVPDAIEGISYLPHDLCGSRQVRRATRREPPAPLEEMAGFVAPEPPSGYRHEPAAPLCVAGQVFAWVSVLDSYDEARGGLLVWREGARWQSRYLPLERPIGGVRIGDAVVLIANGASWRWSPSLGESSPVDGSGSSEGINR
jgi:hypothetical protein